MKAKPYTSGAIGGCVGCTVGPVLLLGLVSTWKYLHGQVLDSGQYKHDTVAYAWTDGIDANGDVTLKQFYAAHIYTVERSTGFDVYCQVEIGSGMHHDCGYLGRVSDPIEARQLWGKVEWTDTVLIVGDPANRGITEPRRKIQNHR